MISVVLYGRNDAHGYNLHRRAALSLNCIAEVLTDPDDELIFVDYNTPDELPTFVEAIADTLTDHCLERLRVFRVPAAVHDQRFAPGTHLPAIEPVARNVAIRHANPSNRWVLSTNTDMIFVPLQSQGLSEICRNLPDGFYALPRFELPEWLWEWFPRTDPRHAMAEIHRLGPAFRLDEPTVSHEWIRFDAPGDFQLILREDLVAIDGFDEEMQMGYHVDSNLSRRLLLHRGSIESLETHLAGYHCDHNRTRTVYHGAPIANDLQRFFYGLQAAELPAQRATWGLADLPVDEVPIRSATSARCAAVLAEVIPPGPRWPSDAFKAPYSVAYDSGHVLPFVVDTLVVSPLDAQIAYVGANPTLEEMLRQVVDRIGFAGPMVAAGFDDLQAIERIADIADVIIIDLGTDVSQRGVPASASHPLIASRRLPRLPPPVTGVLFALLHLTQRMFRRRVAGPPRPLTSALHALRHVIPPAAGGSLPTFPPPLTNALHALEHLIRLERKRYKHAMHARPMMLVNSSAVFWDAFVLAQFDCSYTTIHSRVRRATVKPVRPDASVYKLWLRGQRAIVNHVARGCRRLSWRRLSSTSRRRRYQASLKVPRP